jgi:ABC-type bacteriocin/lantibiotic exporter with double-glycine peptidase domain
MVLAYWGVQRNQRDLAEDLQTIPKAGTPGSRIQRLASRFLNVYYSAGELTQLESALEQGIPPIALVYTAELPYWNIATAHAVVLLGMSSDHVILNDPSLEQGSTTVSLGDFHLAWDEMANFYALLKKL